MSHVEAFNPLSTILSCLQARVLYQGRMAANHGSAEKDVETMRNSLFLLLALGTLTIFAAPAAAGSDEGSCSASSSAAQPGPINLDAIPMQDATGPKAIRGVGDDDECGDGLTSDKAALNSPDDDDGLGEDD
ncbi:MULTISPECIES: hypothetical protein [unclassified Mesorhizobium]|uniref:hypothetical protein n=1 Tax=unclassified Mesorhizobium TaxID=325217 RepID=UPI001092ED04|nr:MULTISPECIES: hypothetical protein [unclassified Mesorhizobium]TGQ37049.1 hypothetical protein EN857_15855 [Mesorhizobium sp. M4B.F.Ca.ET.214.01.1.1]TGQ59342.1 hypothetical protein EN854_18585 [Mesorhizobium sp. M4B.F.Ca.ET.211.01.1.1]TGU34068.1 hypothetical protein EN793_18580 [Mesorhizobium sp. M4B.F.Ca.ET.150.01.1.1]